MSPNAKWSHSFPVTIDRSHWGSHPPLLHSLVAEEEGRDKPGNHQLAVRHSVLDTDFGLYLVMALGVVAVKGELGRVGIGFVFAEARAEYVDKVPARVAVADRIVVGPVAVADAVSHLWVSSEKASTRPVFHLAGDEAGMIAAEYLWG